MGSQRVRRKVCIVAAPETAESLDPGLSVDTLLDIGDADPKIMVLRFEARHPTFRGRVVTVSQCNKIRIETHFEVGPYGMRTVFVEAG